MIETGKGETRKGGRRGKDRRIPVALGEDPAGGGGRTDHRPVVLGAEVLSPKAGGRAPHPGEPCAGAGQTLALPGTSPGKGRSPSNSCCSGAPPSSGRCGSCCARSPTGRPSPTGSCPRPWPAAGACPVFPPRPWAGRWGATPFPCWCPATGWWGPGGASPATRGGLERKRRLLELERGVLFEG